jgi:hypothetical protein
MGLSTLFQTYRTWDLPLDKYENNLARTRKKSPRENGQINNRVSYLMNGGITGLKSQLLGGNQFILRKRMMREVRSQLIRKEVDWNLSLADQLPNGFIAQDG